MHHEHTHRHAPRTSAALLAAAGLFLLGSLGFLGGAAMLMPTKPAVCAAVDLEKVYAALHEQASADAELNALAASMNDQAENKRKLLEELKADLDIYKPGSANAKTATAKLELELLRYNALVDFNRQKIEARRAEYIRAIYGRVKSTLKTLAKENSIDIVFLDDSIPELEPTDAQRTMQQISARRMLYCNDDLNITDALIQRMNADFLAGGGKAPPPAPAKPAAPAAGAPAAAAPTANPAASKVSGG